MKTRQLFLTCALVTAALPAMASTAPAIYRVQKHQAAPPSAGVMPNRPAVVAPAARPSVLAPSRLSAAEIVDRNVAARGGLAAWRAVDTLTLSGQLEAGGVKNTRLPFVMEMKRPHKSRLEIRFDDQTALQVYDGKQGWKVRPYLNRDDVEPFTPDEAKAAASWAELDGPLVDFASKGIRVEVKGMEKVEDHDTYKLLLTMKDGVQRHLWVDASTFLERKIEGDPRKMDGRMREVDVYYRDYQTENGLLIPHTLETVVEGLNASHKMVIEQVKINAPMGDALFAKPQVRVAAAQPAQ